MDERTHGQVAYEVYGKALVKDLSRGTLLEGLKPSDILGTWEGLTDTVRGAWELAAAAVLERG